MLRRTRSWKVDDDQLTNWRYALKRKRTQSAIRTGTTKKHAGETIYGRDFTRIRLKDSNARSRIGKDEA